MGTICTKKQPLQNYTPISAPSVPVLKPSHAPLLTPSLDPIKLTTKKLSQIADQCLLIFVDTQCNTSRNRYLNSVKPNLGAKLQEYLDVELKGKCLNPGDALIVELRVEGIGFSSVAFLCVNIWQAADKALQDPLEQDIQHALSSIQAKKIPTVCLTNFDTEFGINQQASYKAISRAVLAKRDNFKAITLACLSQEGKNAFRQVLEREAVKMGDVSSGKLGGSARSDYF